MDDERREITRGRSTAGRESSSTSELPDTANVVLYLSGQMLLPGLVNSHHHLHQKLTRNLPQVQSINLFPWLLAHYET